MTQDASLTCSIFWDSSVISVKWYLPYYYFSWILLYLEQGFHNIHCTEMKFSVAVSGFVCTGLYRLHCVQAVQLWASFPYMPRFLNLSNLEINSDTS